MKYEFTPNQLDARFKIWTTRELPIIGNLIEDGKLIRFDTLRQKYK